MTASAEKVVMKFAELCEAVRASGSEFCLSDLSGMSLIDFIEEVAAPSNITFGFGKPKPQKKERNGWDDDEEDDDPLECQYVIVASPRPRYLKRNPRFFWDGDYWTDDPAQAARYSSFKLARNDLNHIDLDGGPDLTVYELPKVDMLKESDGEEDTRVEPEPKEQYVLYQIVSKNKPDCKGTDRYWNESALRWELYASNAAYFSNHEEAKKTLRRLKKPASTGHLKPEIITVTREVE